MGRFALKIKNSENIIVKICQLTLLIQTYAMFSQTWKYGSKFASTLWQDFGLDSNLAYMIDRGAMTFVLSLALLGIVHAKRWVYLTIGFWTLFLAGNTFYQGGSFGAPYAIFAQAVRYCLPFGLALWAGMKRSNEEVDLEGLFTVLTVGIAATFITHGIEALNHHPKFIDFIIRTFRNYLQIEVSQARAELLLIPIGVIDIVAGLALLVARSRPILYYMAFWGLLTASVRWLFSPQFGLDGMLLRAANGMVPVILLLGSYIVVESFQKRRKFVPMVLKKVPLRLV